MLIDIYNKDTCLEIAHVVNKVIEDKTILLYGIPDYIFGLKLKVDSIDNGDYTVKGILPHDGNKSYNIPPYFIRNVFEEVKHDKRG